MLSTKDVKAPSASQGMSKTLNPGNHVCTINGIQLVPFPYKPDSYHLVLSLEGPALESFEGFFINKDDESKGRYAGQIGTVKVSEWAYADGQTKSGIDIKKDEEILKAIKGLCTSLGIDSWFTGADGKYATIEDFVKAFDTEKPFAKKPMLYCIAGKEYTNKGGYNAYELFLPKYTKAGAPYGNENVVKFTEADHIKKKKAEAVTDFDTSAQPGMEAPSEFTLE